MSNGQTKNNYLAQKRIGTRRYWLHVGIMLALLIVVVIAAAGIGSVYIPPLEVARILLSKLPLGYAPIVMPESWETIIIQIRFPRIALAALVGAGLAISGATYQGLFRNPLADPYLIGVASGAGLGATVVLVTNIPVSFNGFSILPISAFVGGITAALLAYSIARRSGGLPLTTLILAGVAIAALFGAVTSLLMIRSNPDVKPLLGWLLGGFTGTQWGDVQILLPYLIVGSLGMLAYGRVLNLFQLNEEEAEHLGVNVERTKVVLVVFASLTTGAAVSVSGLIGFVGLVAPHTVRILWGRDHRLLLPLSMFVGSIFLILADLVARTITSPSELPVGVVTAFCGAPFFLYLLHRVGRIT